MTREVVTTLNGSNSKMVSVITGRTIHAETSSEKTFDSHIVVDPDVEVTMDRTHTVTWKRESDQTDSVRNV